MFRNLIIFDIIDIAKSDCEETHYAEKRIGSCGRNCDLEERMDSAKNYIDMQIYHVVMWLLRDGVEYENISHTRLWCGGDGSWEKCLCNSSVRKMVYE